MAEIIPVTSGVGAGDTKLAAFDAALWNAGIANYNLIRLSSIIPLGFEPKEEEVKLDQKKFGNKLYVVYASHTENEIGKEAWAGIGWVVSSDEPKRGLFVEHEGGSKREVEALIQETLQSMIRYRTEDNFGPVCMKVVGVKCESKPVCAVVAAVYKSEGWK